MFGLRVDSQQCAFLALITAAPPETPQAGRRSFYPPQPFLGGKLPRFIYSNLRN